MFCKHKDCRKTLVIEYTKKFNFLIFMFSSCLICLHEVPILEENYDEDDDEEYEDNIVKRN